MLLLYISIFDNKNIDKNQCKQLPACMIKFIVDFNFTHEPCTHSLLYDAHILFLIYIFTIITMAYILDNNIILTKLFLLTIFSDGHWTLLRYIPYSFEIIISV